jgi:hypothetical protein
VSLKYLVREHGGFEPFFCGCEFCPQFLADLVDRGALGPDRLTFNRIILPFRMLLASLPDLLPDVFKDLFKMLFGFLRPDSIGAVNVSLISSSVVSLN